MQTQPNHGFVETEVGPIPADWGLVRLGDAVVQDRQTLNPQHYPEEVFEYYSIPAFQEYDRPIPEIGEEIKSQKLVVKPDTVLFGKLNPRVPKIWMVGRFSEHRKLASTEFIPLVARSEKLQGRFLYYLAQSEYVLPASQDLVTGSTPSRQRVDVTAFMDICIPLPPLPEQRRIAAVLNAIQEDIAAQEDIIAEARAFKRSLMQRLFTYGPGPVPAETRESEIGEIPSHWALTNVESIKADTKRAIVSGPFGSNIGKKFFVNEGVPLIRGNNLTKGEQRFVDRGYVFITEEKAEELKSCEALADDLVFTAAGTIGQVGLIPYDSLYPRYIISNKQLRVRVNTAIAMPEYLFYWFTGETIQTLIQQRRRGTSIPVINLGILRDLPVVLPPLTVQHQIADMLADADSKIAAEEDRKAALQDVFKSTLHQLMTGQIRLLSDEGPPR